MTDNQTIWKTIDPNIVLSVEIHEKITNIDNHRGNCSFVLSNKTRVYQDINLRSYSLLIDTDNAGFYFSAFANCNHSYFGINMYRSDGILQGVKIYSSKKKNKHFHFFNIQ